jgi:hypothetical protein
MKSIVIVAILLCLAHTCPVNAAVFGTDIPGDGIIQCSPGGNINSTVACPTAVGIVSSPALTSGTLKASASTLGLNLSTNAILLTFSGGTTNPYVGPLGLNPAYSPANSNDANTPVSGQVITLNIKNTSSVSIAAIDFYLQAKAMALPGGQADGLTFGLKRVSSNVYTLQTPLPTGTKGTLNAADKDQNTATFGDLLRFSNVNLAPNDTATYTFYVTDYNGTLAPNNTPSDRPPPNQSFTLQIVPTPASMPTAYGASILDVPTGTPNTCETHVHWVNNKGQVLGRFLCPASGATAQVLWTNTVPTALADPPGYQGSVAYSLNNNGIVTGAAISKTDNTSHPVQWINGVPTVHSLVPGAKNDSGVATNDGGDLVVSTDSLALPGGVIWIGNSPVNLVTTATCIYGNAPVFYPLSLNDSRQVAGGDCYAFEVVQPGSIATVLAGTEQPNSTRVFVYPFLGAINNLGDVAGVVNTLVLATTSSAGTLWHNGVGQSIFASRNSPQYYFLGVNNLDQILTVDPQSLSRPETLKDFAIWQNGQFLTLDGLITLTPNIQSFSSPLRSKPADPYTNVINDNGEIALEAMVSCGSSCTTTRGVLLSPVAKTITTMTLNRTSLNFSATNSAVTDPQTVTLTFSGGASVPWTAATTQSNITVNSKSGTGSGSVQIAVTAGSSGVVTITAPGTTNSPQQIQVNVTNVTPALPFGSFDTPLDGTVGVAGAIPVTGWALDNNQVTHVDIFREPVAAEPAGNLVFVGTAVFSADARPDVATQFPNYPFQYRAGWGYQMLTNFLPNSNGSPGTGNGTYKLHAIAFNKAGLQLDLGTRTITVDNAHAAKPFGTIDTPSQGGTISGADYVNFGWALTPQPGMVPLDGSTITVAIDGVATGHPTYNQFRSDIATLFPNYKNSMGAVGFFHVNTTTLSNGVHTISWNAFDNLGRGEGLGSRYFNVLNTSSGVLTVPEDVIDESLASQGVQVLHGLNVNRQSDPIVQGSDGGYSVTMEEVGLIELQLGAATGNMAVEGEALALPTGSTLKGGVFYWQPGPGFLGEYTMHFARPDGSKILVRVKIVPKRF